ncbi:MAG: dephospho-CoA kinase [Bacteroidetes bacterium]|nr:dephospho-CoA kinase [Bacteroidota bacterium]
MSKTLQIGLTGGIGSGKSTVAKIFSTIGIPVYYADDRSKFILQSDSSAKEKIVKEWGATVLDSKGSIDKKALAALVFSQPEEHKKLNAILHPLVAEDYRLWLQQQHDVPYVVKEAAILIESGSYKNCDKIIMVVAPESVAISRVIARDGISAEQVKQRIANQMPVDEKVKWAHFIVRNDNHEMLIPQVLEIHHNLKNIYGNSIGSTN